MAMYYWHQCSDPTCVDHKTPVRKMRKFNGFPEPWTTECSCGRTYEYTVSVSGKPVDASASAT